VKYERPPITEALVELHFSEQNPDHGVGARFYDAWKSRCQKREQIQFQRFHIGVAPTAPPPPPPPMPTDRLWFDEPVSIVHVGPRYLSTHVLHPYPGFDAFLPRLQQSIDQYRSLVQPVAIEQVAMRYINRIDLPLAEDGSVAEWLKVGVLLPDTFHGLINGFNVHSSVDMPEIASEIRYSFRSGKRSESSAEVWIDIQVTSKKGSPPTLDSLDEWLHVSHDKGIILSFEGSVTDAARTAFGVNYE